MERKDGEELVVDRDLANLSIESPSRVNISQKFPPLTPRGISFFTPCAIPEEDNRPKPVSSLTKLIHDSHDNTPTPSNYNSVNNSELEFQTIYSEINATGILSCDMLLKRAVNELFDSNRDENLSLYPAENDGVLMDDLPEFSRSSDITSSGITHFIVVDKRNSRHLLHYKIDKVISENKIRSKSIDNYTISCMRPRSDHSHSQEWKTESVFCTSSKQRANTFDYCNKHSSSLPINSPTRSVINSPTKVNEENETYEFGFIREVSSNDSFSDTWVESGSGKSEIAMS